MASVLVSKLYKTSRIYFWNMVMFPLDLRWFLKVCQILQTSSVFASDSQVLTVVKNMDTKAVEKCRQLRGCMTSIWAVSKNPYGLPMKVLSSQFATYQISFLFWFRCSLHITVSDLDTAVMLNRMYNLMPMTHGQQHSSKTHVLLNPTQQNTWPVNASILMFFLFTNLKWLEVLPCSKYPTLSQQFFVGLLFGGAGWVGWVGLFLNLLTHDSSCTGYRRMIELLGKVAWHLQRPLLARNWPTGWPYLGASGKVIRFRNPEKKHHQGCTNENPVKKCNSARINHSLLLMVQKSHSQPPGMYKNPVKKCGWNYQPHQPSWIHGWVIPQALNIIVTTLRDHLTWLENGEPLMESMYNFLLKNGDIPLLVYQRVEDKTLYVTMVDPVDPCFSRNDSQLDKTWWRCGFQVPNVIAWQSLEGSLAFMFTWPS